MAERLEARGADRRRQEVTRRRPSVGFADTSHEWGGHLFGPCYPSVDDQARGHYESRFVGGQVERRVGNILGPAEVVAELALADRRHPLLRVRVGVLQVALDEGCQDRPG